jgi:bacterioferritin
VPRLGEEDDVKGDPAIIGLLNEVLTNELTAVNQYFLHARICENWGYDRLYEKFREESMDEMKDADELIERVLYLEGLPNLQRYGKVDVGENVPEMFRLDLEVEKNAIATLNRGIELCRSKGDNGSAELLEEILEGEEEHANWLETQIVAIEQVGVQNYLAEQLKKKSS